MFNFYLNSALEIKYIWMFMIIFLRNSGETIVSMSSNDKKDEKEHDYFSNGSSAIKEKK